MSAFKQLKKLSVKTVYGTIDIRALAQRADAEGPLQVMHVTGTALDTKSGDGHLGAWTALVGQFVCINAETGEEFRGNTLFLPEVALNEVRMILAMPGNKAASFMFTIGVQWVANAKPGGVPYEYVLINRAPVSDADPMEQARAALLAAVNGQAKLEGPKGDAASNDGEATKGKGKKAA